MASVNCLKNTAIMYAPYIPSVILGKSDLDALSRYEMAMSLNNFLMEERSIRILK